MKKVIYNLFVSIVLTFYTISALELNVFGIKNAFFDDFDTYIESKEQNLFIKNKEEKNKDDNQIFFQNNDSFSFHLVKSNKTIFYQINSYYQPPPQCYQGNKIHILHAVWLV